LKEKHRTSTDIERMTCDDDDDDDDDDTVRNKCNWYIPHID